LSDVRRLRRDRHGAMNMRGVCMRGGLGEAWGGFTFDRHGSPRAPADCNGREADDGDDDGLAMTCYRVQTQNGTKPAQHPACPCECYRLTLRGVPPGVPVRGTKRDSRTQTPTQAHTKSHTHAEYHAMDYAYI